MRDAVVRREIAPMPRLEAAIEAIGRGVARVRPGLRLPLHVVSNMRALTNDPKFTRLLLSDHGAAGVKLPLCFLKSLIEYCPAVEPEDFDLCPIHMFHPGQDRWTPLTASMRFLDRARAPNGVTIIRGAGHLPITRNALEQLRIGVTEFVGDRTDSWQGRSRFRAA
jgi:alpha-beta hydrolase superfamily lysophospholipase